MIISYDETLDLIFDVEPGSLLVESMPFFNDKSTVDGKWQSYDSAKDV